MLEGIPEVFVSRGNGKGERGHWLIKLRAAEELCMVSQY